MHYGRISITDSKDSDLLAYLDSAIEFIDKGLQRGSVLVQWYARCFLRSLLIQRLCADCSRAGVSRSASGASVVDVDALTSSFVVSGHRIRDARTQHDIRRGVRSRGRQTTFDSAQQLVH